MLTTTNPTAWHVEPDVSGFRIELDAAALEDIRDRTKLEAERDIVAVLAGRRQFFDMLGADGHVRPMSALDLGQFIKRTLDGATVGRLIAALASCEPGTRVSGTTIAHQVVGLLADLHAERTVKQMGVRHG